MEHNSDPFQNAKSQLDAVTSSFESQFSEALIEKLYIHDYIHKAKLDLELSGESVVLDAFRAQHNNALGPYKGGIRFHQGVSESEVKALSMWMTWKSALIDLPYGGGKGGVVVNARDMSRHDLNKIARAYIRAFSDHIGPDIDVPAPDVNTDSQIMAVMLDEYENIRGKLYPATITGKPIDIGGSQGRTEATGYGGYTVLKEVLNNSNHGDDTLDVAVQGFGNVAQYFIERCHNDNSLNIVAVSDSKGGVYNPNGIDFTKLKEVKSKYGTVANYENADQITNDELLELNVDILAPAALENVINESNVSNISADIVLELANGPTTSEADKLLEGQDTLVIPDILANAGGVTVSYLEWVQNRMGYYWEKDKVLADMDKKLKAATNNVYNQYSEKSGTLSLRYVAYIVAVERVLKAMQLKSGTV